MQSLHRCLVPLKWLFPTFFFAQKEKKGKRKLEPNNSNDDDDSKLECYVLTYLRTYLGQWKSHKNDTLDFFYRSFHTWKMNTRSNGVGFPILPSKSCWRQWLRVWTCPYYRVIQLVQFTVSTPKPKSIV